MNKIPHDTPFVKTPPSINGDQPFDINAVLDESMIAPDPPTNGVRRTFADLQQTLDSRAAQCTKRFLFDCLSRGELGSAELLARVANGDIVYDRESEQWYWWNGLHWEEERGGNIFALAGEVLSSVYRQTAAQSYAARLELEQKIGGGKATEEQSAELTRLDGERRNAEAQAKTLYKLANIRNVLVFAGATELLGVLGDVWDAQPDLLGVNNGVIDLTTGRPVAPDPTQYIRTVARANYDPAATCPLNDRASLEIMGGNAEMDAYIWRILGYAMSGTGHEVAFPVWHGKKGQNGKEFLLDRVRAVLGDKLTGAVESELLLKSKAERTANSATPALMALRGRRIAWATETNEGRTFDNATMKQLTGGHIITGRANYGGQEEWRRTHTLIMLTNHKPHVGGGGGDAEWERIRLVEFPISFVDEPDPNDPSQRKRDPTLGDRIDAAELSGILNKLIAACLDWRRNGMQTPQAVKDATAAYRTSEDTLGDFISERCVIHASARVAPGKLYQEYKDWCISNGYSPMGSGTFGNKIEDRGCPRRPSNGVRYFNGIGLATSELGR